MLLSFELNENNEGLEIYIDQEGAKALKSYFDLEDGTHPDHAHLLTPSWGDHHLTEKSSARGMRF